MLTLNKFEPKEIKVMEKIDKYIEATKLTWSSFNEYSVFYETVFPNYSKAKFTNLSCSLGLRSFCNQQQTMGLTEAVAPRCCSE